MSNTRRIASVLFLFYTFFIDQVACRRVRGGGGRVGGGIVGAIGKLDLGPVLTAVFVITIVIGIIALYQLSRATKRLKHPVLTQCPPPLQYDVGKTFLWLLFSYLFVYMSWNVLFAVFTALWEGQIYVSGSFAPVMAFVAQLADIFFLVMILVVVAYRQRLQLNPREKVFNVKTFLDIWILSVILILGVTVDAFEGVVIARKTGYINHLQNINVAYEVFNFIGSVDVIVTAVMAHMRLKKSGIPDNIVRSAAFFVSPLVFIRTLYRIIEVGLFMNVKTLIGRDRLILRLVATVIGGITSIAVTSLCLAMGAPPKPPKDQNTKS